MTSLDLSYRHLLILWTSGVRSYHTMLSVYLAANSILVAMIGLIVSRETLVLPLTVLIGLLCIFGILLCFQMAIVLGRLSGQNEFWAWKLRGIEQDPKWNDREKLITDLRQIYETGQPIEDRRNKPMAFKPNWAFRQQREWWSRRAISFPWFFGSVYAALLIWSVIK